MKKSLLLCAASLAAVAASAQSYISSAPAAGFDVNTGKDYVVYYAPENVINAMGSKVVSNQNLDPDQVNNYLMYWTCDWAKDQLTIYNYDEADGKNSWGASDYINAIPLWDWGTGAFSPKAKAYTMDKITPAHHMSIGIRDFGSAPSKYKLTFGDTANSKGDNKFEIELGIAYGAAAGNFVGIGSLPNGNDGKWYYIDIPVADLIDPDGDFGFTFDNTVKVTGNNGIFMFTFDSPTCATYTYGAQDPESGLKKVNVTKINSAMSIDHVFFYVPDNAGIDEVNAAAEEVVFGYYDLQGRKVSNPANGIFVKKTNLGVTKVAL